MDVVEQVEKEVADLIARQPAVKPLLDRMNGLTEDQLAELVMEVTLAAAMGLANATDAEILTNLATITLLRRHVAAEAKVGMRLN